ncbi:PIR protein CIR protein [Plasmodium vinckei vinckei]|uniref:PIR protein CIR protein n=1 Tax=Plasmodium vinckei vinckei TaxID=54757 RepID=A0A449BMN3_PLAVN|nr:PIR protein CIR protein [Plasmodium vinckei vinckei]VEV54716.1 PIR protein CIR protein [Plasmodium vinckei vinckei]
MSFSSTRRSMKEKGSNNDVNQNYEYVFMWLGDKFRNIVRDPSFSISDYYEDVIVKSGANFNCWDKLDSKYLKGSNLSMMTSLYSLLTNICKAVVENEISQFNIEKFKTNDLKCYGIYKLINDEKNKCYPYIQLLTDLKTKYDEYRNLAIKEVLKKDNYNLTFLPIGNDDSQKDLLFQSNGCIKLHGFFGQPRQKPKPKIPPDDSETKKETQPSNIGEELNFEKIKDYSVQIFDKYSPQLIHTATSIENHIRDMVRYNFINIVGIGSKYIKAIENVKLPKFQILGPNNKEKESEKSKKEKVNPPTPPQTTQGTTVSSDNILSKVVNVPGCNLMGLNRNITRFMSFKFEGNNVAIIALTVVSITIVLAIVHWYLYYGCRKPMKKKKMGNKIINLVDEKGREKRIISPIDRKRGVKTNIDSDYEEKATIVIINPYDEKNISIQRIKPPSLKITLLNTYKYIYFNPSPFINLFFLLIFFVYKRK